MRRIIIGLGLIAVAIMAASGVPSAYCGDDGVAKPRVITVSGWGAKSKALYDEMIRYITRKQHGMIRKMLIAGDIVSLEPGQKVWLEDASIWGWVCVRPEGSRDKLWTVRHLLDQPKTKSKESDKSEEKPAMDAPVLRFAKDRTPYTVRVLKKPWSEQFDLVVQYTDVAPDGNQAALIDISVAALESYRNTDRRPDNVIIIVSGSDGQWRALLGVSDTTQYYGSGRTLDLQPIRYDDQWLMRTTKSAKVPR